MPADRGPRVQLFLHAVPDLVLPVLVILMHDRGLSMGQVGAVAAIASLVVAVCELPTGGVADARGHRPVQLVAAGLDTVALVGCSAAGSFSGSAAAAVVRGLGRALDSGEQKCPTFGERFLPLNAQHCVTVIRRTRAAAARVGVAERPDPGSDLDLDLHPAPDPGAEDGPAVSFDDLYRASAAHMIRLAWLLLGSRPMAEDVVHDAFVTVHQRWDQLDNPGGYLRRTVVNGALRAQRRRSSEARAFASVGEPPPTGDPAVDSMWDAIVRLTPSRRAVVVLRYWADLPHADIARLMGCPIATVRTRLHRALADLRKEIAR